MIDRAYDGGVGFFASSPRFTGLEALHAQRSLSFFQIRLPFCDRASDHD